MNKFPERLRELREEKNLSQRGLSKLVGLSQASIARWEAGFQVPNIDIAIIFAKFFGCTTDYLLGLDD